MSNLGKAAQPRRFYHHVLNGGTLTPENVSLMVQTIEELEAEVKRMKAAVGILKDGTHALATIANEQRARAETAEAKLATAVEALEDIANQKRTDELETEYDVECADFEGGYDACIDVARAAIHALKGGDK